MTPEPSKEQYSPYEPPRAESDPVENDWRDRITPKHFAMATYGGVLLFLLGPIGIAIAIAILTRLFTHEASGDLLGLASGLACVRWQVPNSRIQLAQYRTSLSPEELASQGR